MSVTETSPVVLIVRGTGGTGPMKIARKKKPAVVAVGQAISMSLIVVMPAISPITLNVRPQNEI